MQKISLNTITNYLMFLTLCLFSAGCLFVFSVMLISRLQGDTPSPTIPWTTLQIGFVLIIVPFVAKRLFAKVIAAPEEVVLPAGAGIFVGFLQGLLYGGAILVIGGIVLFCFNPQRLFSHDLFYYSMATLGVTGVAGAFFAPVRVARKARLWLLLALISQFVTLSALRQLLGLFPLKFDYTVAEINFEKMPLADSNLVNWLVPDGAKNIHIYGTRGEEARVQCQITAEQLKEFAKKNKLELPETESREFAFGNNETVVFIYNRESGVLIGFFRRDGLPGHLRRETKAEEKKPAGQ
ncbi:MAG: hypothetical protein E7042_06325 [Lentisphaerae bacterium]|nr:hypothetical protein [Lentisphaerota bacterium]